ncbi:MAG: TIGR01244 family sulfur transferase [Rhizobiaceae bacterium]
MNRIAELEKNVFTAAHIGPQDVAFLARSGFGTIVCNRPDEELEGEMKSVQARSLAARHGLAFHYLPVWNFDVADEVNVTAFRELLDSIKGPVLFYCRSGRRSTLLWAQASAGRLGIDTVVSAAEQAGHDRETVHTLVSANAGLELAA